MPLGTLVLLGCVAIAAADFACLCGHGGTSNVYSSKDATGTPLGTLGDGECKAISDQVEIDINWLSIDYHHTVSFVERSDKVAFSKCPGDPSSLDAPTTPGGGIVGSVTTQSPGVSESESYPCICGHGGTVIVYQQKSTSSPALGALQDQQCKPISTSEAIDAHWLAVDYFQQIGYVERTGLIFLSKCLGKPSPLDIVTTGSPGVQTTHFPMFTTTDSTVSGSTHLCPSHLVHDTNIDHGMLTQYGRSCYEIVPHLVSWSHAELNCRQKGGHLVSITSSGEQEFLYHYLDQNYNHTMWIGLHDRQQEEQFQWSSGESVGYLNWAPGRKTWTHDQEDCVFMIPTLVLRGAWDDIPCGGDNPIMEQFGELHRFICEFEADELFSREANSLTLY